MAEKAYEIAFNDEAVDEDFYGDVESLTVEENCHDGQHHASATGDHAR